MVSVSGMGVTLKTVGASSVVRQLELLLFRTALARVTLARMSLALAVQMNGFGLALWTAMYSAIAAFKSATLLCVFQRSWTPVSV